MSDKVYEQCTNSLYSRINIVRVDDEVMTRMFSLVQKLMVFLFILFFPSHYRWTSYLGGLPFVFFSFDTYFLVDYTVLSCYNCL